MKKTLKDINFQNKKVILRCDFNVPIENGIIQSSKRIDESLKTIQYLIDQNAKIIILSHLGRIKNEEDKLKYDLSVVAKMLAQKLDHSIKFINETRGKEVEQAINNMKIQDIVLLQNTRYEDLKGNLESKNDDKLAQYWASLADIFVNDGFGAAHRKAASNVGISKYIKESAIGFLIEKEMKMLSKVINSPKKPFVAIVGGAKVSDKIDFINILLEKADKLILSGGMAYTFLKALDQEVGESLVEKESIEIAKTILKSPLRSKIILPIDFAITKSFSNEPRKEIIGSIPKGYQGLDVGIKTVKLFVKEIGQARTVLWNGPLGVTEFTNYIYGTNEIAKAIANLDNVYSVIGGGDSASAAIRLGYEEKFNHISTGGGASLSFMKEGTLVAIEAIQDK